MRKKKDKKRTNKTRINLPSSPGQETGCFVRRQIFIPQDGVLIKNKKQNFVLILQIWTFKSAESFFLQDIFFQASTLVIILL